MIRQKNWQENKKRRRMKELIALIITILLFVISPLAGFGVYALYALPLGRAYPVRGVIFLYRVVRMKLREMEQECSS